VLAFFSLFIINNLQEAARLPAETWTIDGAIPLPLNNPEFSQRFNGFCPLRLPANTALTQQFQFLIWSGLETFSGQAVDAGLVKTEELSGNLRGQRRLTVYPNPIFIDGDKKEFPEPEGRVRTRHFNSQIAMKLKVI
jgi:hypothetical protein